MPMEAIRALDKVVHRGEVNWILEADIVSFFDSLDRTKLKEMLQVRVAILPSNEVSEKPGTVHTRIE